MTLSVTVTWSNKSSLNFIIKVFKVKNFVYPLDHLEWPPAPLVLAFHTTSYLILVPYAKLTIEWVFPVPVCLRTCVLLDFSNGSHWPGFRTSQTILLFCRLPWDFCCNQRTCRIKTLKLQQQQQRQSTARSVKARSRAASPRTPVKIKSRPSAKKTQKTRFLKLVSNSLQWLALY